MTSGWTKVCQLWWDMYLSMPSDQVGISSETSKQQVFHWPWNAMQPMVFNLIHVEVKHPDEINTLLTQLYVYAKGSRLMHMLRRWLGDDTFRKGLKACFEKHQYSNTIGRDLWNALGDASGRDVAAFMDSWLEQPGYPVLTAVVENDTLKISQNNSSLENMKTRPPMGLCHWTATGLVFQTHLKQKRLKSQVMLPLLLK